MKSNNLAARNNIVQKDSKAYQAGDNKANSTNLLSFTGIHPSNNAKHRHTQHITSPQCMRNSQNTDYVFTLKDDIPITNNIEHDNTQLFNSNNHQHKALLFNPKDWTYKIEGGKHIILSYHGKDSELKNQVLRIEKEQINNRSSQQNYSDEAFIQKYIEPVVGSNHVLNSQKVCLSNSCLQAISQLIHPARPLHRAQTGSFTLSAKVELQPDLTKQSPHALTIEIKPKSPLLSQSIFISNQHIKKQVPPFELMQQYKLSKKTETHKSLYDPAKLFSGNPSQVAQALRDLVKTPQNNLRLFHQGELVENIDTFSSNNPLFNQSELIDNLSQAILSTDVMDNILSLQQRDIIDVEGAAYILDKDRVTLSHLSNHEFWSNTHIDKGNIESIPKFIPTSNEPDRIDQQAKRFIDALHINQRLFLLREYLISVAAKDCSILINLNAEQKDTPQITIVDIGPKPLEKIPKNLQKSLELAQIYKKNL